MSIHSHNHLFFEYRYFGINESINLSFLVPKYLPINICLNSHFMKKRMRIYCYSCCPNAEQNPFLKSPWIKTCHFYEDPCIFDGSFFFFPLLLRFCNMRLSLDRYARFLGLQSDLARFQCSYSSILHKQISVQ